MQNGWPCVTCPWREEGLCGALLEKDTDDARSHQKPNWQHFRIFRAGERIASRHQSQEDVNVLCLAWAFRFFQLANGRRQILGFVLPGDMFSAAAVFEDTAPVSIQALTTGQLSGFRRSEVRARCAVSRAVGPALGHSAVAESTGTHELLAALGQRSAEERVAYLFLDLIRRLSNRNVIREQFYTLPLRQQHIAEALGLTAVHVSRVLGGFRSRGVATFSGGRLQVHDMPELKRIGQLD